MGKGAISVFVIHKGIRVSCFEQNKNQINPLVRMEGVALAAMLPPWSYKSELLTPKTESTTTFLTEGHHPRQGDKQE